MTNVLNDQERSFNTNTVFANMPLWYLYCTFNGTLLVVESLCEVFTKYTIGINPSCTKFKSAPESIKAIKVD